MTTPQKFDIESTRPLKLMLYFYTVQSGLIPMEIPVDLQVILAYTDTEAIDTIRKKYLPGVRLNITKRGEFSVQNLIEVINLPGAKELPITKPDEKKSKEEFVRELLLVADSFVANERDRATLKRIIERNVKLEEPQPIQPTQPIEPPVEQPKEAEGKGSA